MGQQIQKGGLKKGTDKKRKTKRKIIDYVGNYIKGIAKRISNIETKLNR